MLRKTVIITGAAGGIGSASAKAFAKAGYNLSLTYHSQACDQLIKELSQENVEIKAYKLDISKPKEIAKVFAKIFADFDYIDCLIANAGLAESEQLLIEKSDEEIEKVLDVNLFGTIICNRECLKYFIKQKHGNIINISSIYGEEGSCCSAPYSAAKAGVIALTQSLAKEVGSFNIRVNAIAPGNITTPMTACYSAADLKEIHKHIPLGRSGKAEEVASSALFLASDAASYITGHTLSVNGGAVLFV